MYEFNKNNKESILLKFECKKYLYQNSGKR